MRLIIKNNCMLRSIAHIQMSLLHFTVLLLLLLVCSPAIGQQTSAPNQSLKLSAEIVSRQYCVAGDGVDFLPSASYFLRSLR